MIEHVISFHLLFLCLHIRYANPFVKISSVILQALRLKDKNWKRGGQVLVLLNWLFLDELTFQTLIKNIADIIVRKDDRYVALGWCILVRSLVEFESVPCELPLNGSTIILCQNFYFCSFSKMLIR